MPEARRGAARQSLHSVLYSSPAWSPEQPKPNASPAALPPRRDIHPRFARSGRALAPIGRSNSLGEAVERALGVHRSKTARVFAKEENEYHLAACLLAFGSVIFTASNQAIHRETK